MTAKQPFAYVTIFYDGTSNPSSKGWAYNCIDSEGEHTSGTLDARRINAKLPSLHRALRREFRGAEFTVYLHTTPDAGHGDTIPRLPDGAWQCNPRHIDPEWHEWAEQIEARARGAS